MQCNKVTHAHIYKIYNFYTGLVPHRIVKPGEKAHKSTLNSSIKLFPISSRLNHFFGFVLGFRPVVFYLFGKTKLTTGR